MKWILEAPGSVLTPRPKMHWSLASTTNESCQRILSHVSPWMFDRFWPNVPCIWRHLEAASRRIWRPPSAYKRPSTTPTGAGAIFERNTDPIVSSSVESVSPINPDSALRLTEFSCFRLETTSSKSIRGTGGKCLARTRFLKLTSNLRSLL